MSWHKPFWESFLGAKRRTRSITEHVSTNKTQFKSSTLDATTWTNNSIRPKNLNALFFKDQPDRISLFRSIILQNGGGKHKQKEINNKSIRPKNIKTEFKINWTRFPSSLTYSFSTKWGRQEQAHKKHDTSKHCKQM